MKLADSIYPQSLEIARVDSANNPHFDLWDEADPATTAIAAAAAAAAATARHNSIRKRSIGMSHAFILTVDRESVFVELGGSFPGTTTSRKLSNREREWYSQMLFRS